ncbi:TetR/AcrR family transcriptional regulator [Mycobacterium sp. CVI_P3]|uniref:TetR/AcrR family transcriptional regulator n=1 Tax=Mycobacterium pinniadriaticum TaxID=2994102 RepID=A0ABT3SNK6_9MYCO|nr:TetR/AcrR family transcriptional regulator [Mycobacterium pinniadriaticum]MCX2934311.1 TetR/AcrR family transcriptional regulator [Mycobacterium pinniadriaticum]MCX2940734.1 TetR/AcrR family transcriptional regulator [Mycobacterium pinniadriaticum]
MSSADSAPNRRRYDSAVRREQVARTRERIVTAGAQLLHGFPIWNWRALTIRAVADTAGIAERTVYRHFATEKDLRDAVLARLANEADIELAGLSLDEFDQVAMRVLQYVSQFPLEPRTPPDATVEAGKSRQRVALLAALTEARPDWSDEDRTVAAAIFDVLWNVVSYEQLVVEWQLEPPVAIAGISWVIRLVQEAIRDGNAPLRHRPPYGSADS